MTFQELSELLEQHADKDRLLEDIQLKTGLQISYSRHQGGMDVCAPSSELLELAVATIKQNNKDPPTDGVDRTIRDGKVEWTFYGDHAVAVGQLFKDELEIIRETCDVITIYQEEDEAAVFARVNDEEHNDKNLNLKAEQVIDKDGNKYIKPRKHIKVGDIKRASPRDIVKLKIICDFNNYPVMMSTELLHSIV